MITELSPAQIEKMPEYVRRWTNIGLSTEPLDVEAAKDAVSRAYRQAGLPPPQKFVVCSSPLSAAITAASAGASAGDSVWDSVWDSVGASVGDSVWDSVWDSVGDSVRASVRDSIWDSVRASVRDSIWDSVRASVRDSVGASVRDSVWASAWASVGDSVRGPHDAHWFAFYDFLWRELGIEAASALEPLMDAAKAGGWWIPYENVCFLQHRHCELHRDAAGRLHNPLGMAVKYPDGWGVYAWHGVRIPVTKAWLIEEPNRLSFADIEAEGNAELRRVMLEIFGHDRYILESGLQPEQSDEAGELFRKRIPGDEELVMVRVVNSTPEPDGQHRRYMLRVPPNVRTAREAVAWTFGFDEGEYSPIAQS